MVKSQSNREIEELLRRTAAHLLANAGAEVDGELMSQGRGTECENCPFAKQEGGI
jgi:hypothetical protein